MAETRGMMDDLWPAISFGVQVGTAYMVYQLVSNQTSAAAADDSVTKTSRDVVVAKAEPAGETVSPDDKRSVRGENVYGPYKKVSICTT